MLKYQYRQRALNKRQKFILKNHFTPFIPSLLYYRHHNTKHYSRHQDTKKKRIFFLNKVFLDPFISLLL